MVLLVEEKPITQPKIPLRGFYRVCEINPIYECGWIFVSNELELDEALALCERKERENRNPELRYEIVPV